MKALIFSDSHYEKNYPEKAFVLEKPDFVIFLGDGEADFEYFKTQVSKGTPTQQVRGNCDFGSDFPERIVDVVGGVKTFMTHGVKEKVKLGIYVLYEMALINDCKLVLYGHTHQQCINTVEDVTMLNPGSIAEGYYATIEFENGIAKPSLKKVQEELWKEGTK